MKIEWQRAAAYVILLDQTGRILLTKFELPGHKKTGSWTLPGGGMEWGEQAVETAARELWEETGLTAQIGSLLATHSEWIDAADALSGKSGHSLKLLYSANAPTGILKSDFTDDDTTVDAAWFSLKEARALPRVPIVDVALALLDQKRMD